MAGACGGGEAGPATGRFGGVSGQVCRALAEYERGEVEEARDSFDDAHVGLHDVAAAAEADDRAVAARLLEAKQRVEADFSADTLDGLVAPLAAAIETTGGTAPDSCA